LLRGVDSKKDQSYFLFPLKQESLEHILFPLGELTKQDVRKIATQHHLPTSEKVESQEICFITDGDYASFIEGKNPSQIKGPGNFVTYDGKIVGRHRGIHAYTIGQRRGLGFGIGSRQYVVGINTGKNQVTLGSNEDLLRREMLVHHVHWIRPVGDVDLIEDMEVQIRSTHGGAKAHLEMTPDGVRVIFQEPQRAITPGQAAVFYRGEEVLGGGWIV
jgi:tRNA-specific 2-thiouridylase